jgi:mono/diheme cytochrome c family protein
MLHTLTRRARRVTGAKLVKLGWVVFMLLFTAACHLEMYDQPKYKALQSSDFFQDGAAMRPLVDNTVARDGLRTDELTTGRVGGAPDGAYLTDSPVPVTPELIARGQERWAINCAVCHGTVGNGRGSAVYPQFNPRPTSIYDQRLLDAPDGYFYNVIVNGRGAMFPYGSRVQNIEDRWAIIAYIREMQANPPAEQ